MLYNLLSPERRHTRPSKFVDRGSRRPQRPQGRHERRDRYDRRELMTFSVDFLPGFSDERGSTAPVYVADRYSKPQQSWTQPMQQPVSPFETERRRAPIISREGVRLRAGVGMLLAVLILMAGTVAITCGQTIRLNHQTNVDGAAVDDIDKMCEVIEKQIAEGESEVNVTTGAVALGMVYVRNTSVIYLTVPENATYSNPGTGTLSAEYLATIFGQ